MYNNVKYNLGEILIGFSNALDLASPHLAMHQQRVAYISWQIATAADLSVEAKDRIFKAAIIHDIGALTAEEKVNLHKSESKHPENHCILGEMIFNQVPWLQSSSKIVRNHHKEWHEYDVQDIAESDFESQIVLLADTLERAIDRNELILCQVPELRSKIKSLSGNTLHPLVIDWFCAASTPEAFWLDLTSAKLNNILLEIFADKSVTIGLKGLLPLARLFKNIIDFRSPFTATHSSGVASCAAMLCDLFGSTEIEMTLMKVAGYLHDIGKLVVPNSILEKQGKLTDEEFAVIRQHAYHTYSILNNIKGLEQVAAWAAFHHERLDGTGYPFCLDKSEIGIGARILAVADIFTALIEDRPYRKGMSKSQVVDILADLVARDHIDKNVVEILTQNYDYVLERVQEKQREAKKYYTENFKMYLV